MSDTLAASKISGSIIVPEAKVYLRDSTNKSGTVADFGDSGGVSIMKNRGSKFRVWVKILALEDSNFRKGTFTCSLFVVKGNPLIISNSPLACFSSGTDSIEVIDDGSDLCLQIIIDDIGAHMGVPVDEVLELSGGSNERSLTTWDTQSGSMRGTALVEFRIEKEEPHSYAEIISQRKLTRRHPVMEKAYVPSSVLPSGAASVAGADVGASSLAGDILETARSVDSGILEQRRFDLLEQSSRLTLQTRKVSEVTVLDPAPDSTPSPRKRGVLNHISFAVTDTNNLEVED